VAIVLGCGALGSTVAYALHRVGHAVVLADDVDPAWPRRGMAFTNAWYTGTAELADATACFCASMRSVPSVLRQRLIAATTWSWPALAATLKPVVIVDTRMQADSDRRSLRGHAPLTIRLGAGTAEGADVHIAVAPPSPLPGRDEPDAPAAARDGRVDWVRAEHAGRCMTARRIGDRVHAGDVVAQVGRQAIVAPGSGALCGLSARGARVRAGQTVVEIDSRADPALCFGIWDAARPIAAEVLATLPIAAHAA
jgi:xanthine dehydrogenase accessory factor